MMRASAIVERAMAGHPAWVERAVIYAPVPKLWGGGPAAVTRRLPYLARLGVDALWLWPPAVRRTPGQTYAVDDYFELDPDWGPEADFRAMVGRAHGLGMRVLIDIVPNHMSAESPSFRDAAVRGTASPHYAWFDRDAAGEPTHYFDWTNLPNLDYANAEVRAMIVAAFTHWMRQYGIDGFRVDASWGVARRASDFWPELRREVKRIDPDVLLLAEASNRDPSSGTEWFDVAYDWTERPGEWAWASAFDDPDEIRDRLAAAIALEEGCSSKALVLRFLNNNDTEERFVDRYGPATTRVAATLMFTLPGVPAMFAGDEIGASYLPYDESGPIEWVDRRRLRPHYRRLIGLRRSLRSLTGPDVLVQATDRGSAFAYVRPAAGEDPPVLVVLNFGPRAEVGIAHSPALDAAVGTGAVRDLLADRPVPLAIGATSVSLPMAGGSSVVLVPGAR